MRHQKLKILLIFICISTFQLSGQNRIDSVKIYKPQVKNIYTGLKQLESYRDYYSECLQVSNELNQIINNQDKELKKSLKQITILNSDTDALNLKITASEVEIQRLKNKKIPWYKHPLLYGFLGFAGGIYLIK